MAATTKSGSSLRWLILFLASILMLGNYYTYDIPASTKDLLMGYMGMTKDKFETTYSLFYTVYSLPNIVLPFFGGALVDKFGARICLVAFTLFLVLGQLVFALGSVYRSIPVMLLGRTLYGLGGENLSVGQSALIAEWFMGKELAFAFSINLSCSRLGSVINQYVSPVVAQDWGSVNMALFLGLIICCISLVCGLIMAPVDKLVESRLAKQRGPMLRLGREGDKELADPLLEDEERGGKKSLKKIKAEDVESHLLSTQTAQEEEPGLWAQFRGFSYMFWALAWCCLVVYGCILPFNNIASSLLQERNYFIPAPAECHLLDPLSCQSSSNIPIDCPASKWYQPPLPSTLDLSTIDCSDPDFSKPGVCSAEYCTRQNAGLKQADRVASIPYTISAVLSPILGLCVDRFGKRAFVITLAPLLLILVHLMLGLSTSISPAVPLIGQGLAYSAFAAVLWPSVPFTVADDKVGLGYGLVTAIQNSGLALFPLLTAAIYKAAGSSYIPGVEVFFVSLACLGVVGGLWLLYLDAKNGHVLNRVQWKARDEDEEETTTI